MKLNTALILTSICIGSIIAKPALAAGKPVKNYAVRFDEDEPSKKAAKMKAKAAKVFASHNNSSVKIYPDPMKRDMHVVSKSNDGKEITFFVFDLQGTLLQQYKMKPNDHYRIAGLARGTYMYHVFSGDEETAAGKFDIR